MVVVHDVRVHVVRKDVRARAKHVGCRRRKPQRNGDTVDPHPRGRRRRPAHVRVGIGRHSPHDPCVRVLPARDPRPPGSRNPDPAAVVKDDPAERIIADPDPIVVGRERPVARSDVRSKVGTDGGLMRHPHDAVRRVLHPVAVGIERGLKIREGARIGVGVAALGSGFGGRRLLCGHGLGRGRLGGRRRVRVEPAAVALFRRLRESGRHRHERDERARCNDCQHQPRLRHCRNHAPITSVEQPWPAG